MGKAMKKRKRFLGISSVALTMGPLRPGYKVEHERERELLRLPRNVVKTAKRTTCGQGVLLRTLQDRQRSRARLFGRDRAKAARVPLHRDVLQSIQEAFIDWIQEPDPIRARFFCPPWGAKEGKIPLPGSKELIDLLTY